MTIEKFTRDELLQLNETMLGRGMPTQDDGVGYNKADYGACSTYFYGVSYAQLADLAKRLVKYCNTQLGLDKDKMKATESHFQNLADIYHYTKESGISLNVTEEGTLVSFRYNESFIDVLKKQPKRRWDAENKNWIVPHNRVIPTLNHLSTVGADVSNAMSYAMNHPTIKEAIEKKVEIQAKFRDDKLLLKFPFDKDIVEVIKGIDSKDRQFNTKFKYWIVEKRHFDSLQHKLQLIAEFKLI